MNEPELRVLRPHEVEARPADQCFLVRPLWPHPSVSILGGAPKSAKSFLGLDLVASVASGTPFLGRFPVECRGPALVYLAEDSLTDARLRLAALCAHRGLDLAALDLHLIAEPALRLDDAADRRRLRATIERLRPRVLLLDPLVRLHSLSENSARDVAGLLGFLRELERAHDLSVVLVHHTSKKARARPGQALRGSSDLHAWLDVGAYVAWRRDRLELVIEERTAPPPDPLALVLVSRSGPSAHLEIAEPAADPDHPTLAKRILAELRDARGPLLGSELRARLRVNNASLGRTLQELAAHGILVRGPRGWALGKLAEGGS
jgi:hypothetical protein